MSQAQAGNISYFQGTSGSPAVGATANGNGLVLDASGIDGAIQVEIQETNGGTATVTFEGSFDGTTWYAAGYQQVDAVASPARSVSGVSVLANSAHVYQILDPYPSLRARISSVASSPKIVARVYTVAG